MGRPPVVGKERLVVSDLDLRRVSEERQDLDPTGHHCRPDVFTVHVDRRRRRAAAFGD